MKYWKLRLNDLPDLAADIGIAHSVSAAAAALGANVNELDPKKPSPLRKDEVEDLAIQRKAKQFARHRYRSAKRRVQMRFLQKDYIQKNCHEVKFEAIKHSHPWRGSYARVDELYRMSSVHAATYAGSIATPSAFSAASSCATPAKSIQ